MGKLLAQEALNELPGFAMSFPVELTVLGIVLALLAVLMLNLAFTAAFHYPLSRVNYVLQLVSSTLFFTVTAATIGVMLNNLESIGNSWPHMFPYMAPPVPPADGTWTTVQTFFFTVLQVLVVLSVHVRCPSAETHFR
jgi:hypothetical protein